MRRATDAFAVVIALAAFAVSYTTQVVLAGNHGFPGWEAWLWPGIADAAALAMILRLHFGAVRPGWYTVEAWGVFGVASVVMVGANAIADSGDPLGGGMHAVVPVVAMLTWHVVIHGRPAEAVEELEKATIPAPAHATPRATTRARTRARTRDYSRRRVERLLTRTPEITAAEAARRLKLSRSQAARLLAEARRPRVVEEAK